MAEPIEDVGPEDDEFGVGSKLLGVEANPDGGSGVIADGDENLARGLDDRTPGGVFRGSGQVGSIDEVGPIANRFGDGMINDLDGSGRGKGGGAGGKHGARLIGGELRNRSHDGDAFGGFAGRAKFGVEVDDAVKFGWEWGLGFEDGPGLLLNEVAMVVGGEIVLDIKVELDEARQGGFGGVERIRGVASLRTQRGGCEGEIDEVVAVAAGREIDG